MEKSATGPKIAIIGAGPAGLTLANILIRNDITDVTVFEQESSQLARPQGFSLDLHRKTGQAALKAAGLFDHFKQHARYDGQDMVVVDQQNRPHVVIKGVDIGRPEIEREKLRQILLDPLPADTVRWDQKISQVEAGTITLSSGDVESGFDLIVGADGAWSKVRPLLTSVKPFYSGISGCELHFTDFATRHPTESAMIGKGSYFAMGDGRSLLVQRQGGGNVAMLTAAHQPESWIEESGVSVHDDAEMKKLLLKQYSDFSPELKRLIEIADDGVRWWPLYMLPVGLVWQHVPGVTLIGDAAHLMTIFAGEGVNNAMADSLSLAKLIIASARARSDLDSAVLQYEQDMFARTKESAEVTWQSLQLRFFNPEPAKFAAKHFRLVVLLLKIVGFFRIGKRT